MNQFYKGAPIHFNILVILYWGVFVNGCGIRRHSFFCKNMVDVQIVYEMIDHIVQNG